jgi:hypothetical protein
MILKVRSCAKYETRRCSMLIVYDFSNIKDSAISCAYEKEHHSYIT